MCPILRGAFPLASAEEVEQMIREAIPFHIESMREHGEPVPPPSARLSIVVPVA
jgi:predicted RNase H-like HicB family nuclease